MARNINQSYNAMEVLGARNTSPVYAGAQMLLGRRDRAAQNLNLQELMASSGTDNNVTAALINIIPSLMKQSPSAATAALGATGLFSDDVLRQIEKQAQDYINLQKYVNLLPTVDDAASATVHPSVIIEHLLNLPGKYGFVRPQDQPQPVQEKTPQLQAKLNALGQIEYSGTADMVEEQQNKMKAIRRLEILKGLSSRFTPEQIADMEWRNDGQRDVLYFKSTNRPVPGVF